MDIWIEGLTTDSDYRDLKLIHSHLAGIINREMSACPEHWTGKDPFHGMCAVTAMLANRLLGGEILRASLEDLPQYSHMRSHYWNRLGGWIGAEFDLTAEQFKGNDRNLLPMGKSTKRDGQTGAQVKITFESLSEYKPTRDRYLLLRHAWNKRFPDMVVR